MTGPGGSAAGVRESTATAFAEQLRHFRARAGLTQEALAERAGLTASGISALERGVRRRPYLYTRRRLAEALGLSSEEQESFVSRRPAATRAPAQAIAPLPPPVGNLPVARTPLVGRGAERTALQELILHDNARMVTLTGVGGCGKTRLAMQLAEDVRDRFASGVWFVELAGVAGPELVVQSVTTVLGVPETPEVSLLDNPPPWLRSQPVLLVLDNCEHLVDACAALAERLLSHCPQLTILATSREPLQIAGEHRWRVSPLDAPDADRSVAPDEIVIYPAVQLFLARARAVSPAFQLTRENAGTVAQICSRLEGIPLALELAAVRISVLTVEQILARLDDSIRLLTGGSRGAPSRQLTVRGALDWSHDLLTVAERVLFRRLAVFSGGGDLDAIEAVCVDERIGGAELLDLLNQLVNKSLVQVEEEVRGVRYRLLEPVRQYAAHHLLESGEIERIRDRHAEWCATLAAEAAPELRRPSQLNWLKRLEREQDNLRAALRRAEEGARAELGLRLANALVPFWEGHGHLSEGRRWLSTMLALPQAEQFATLRMQALAGAGVLAQWQGDVDLAATLLHEGADLARALGDRRGIANSLAWLGTVARRRGSFGESTQLLEEARGLFTLLDDAWGLAFAEMSLGVTFANQAELAAARPLLEQSLQHFRLLGDLRMIASANTMLGLVLGAQGESGDAIKAYRSGLTGNIELGDRVFAVFALTGLAAVEARTGQPERAARLLGAADALRELVGASPAPLNRASLAETEATIRLQLSQPSIDAARAEGRSLSLDEVLAEAAGAVRAEAGPIRAAAGAAAASRFALTAREEEVGRLVEKGCSDRQIAEALGISVRTVGIHVQHVLAKLGVRSRWQVSLTGEPPPR